MSTGYIQANTDGRLHSAAEPSITPVNRGFLYGDAIYEVWRTFEETIFAFHEHWDRFELSARALSIDLPLSREQAVEELRRTAREFWKATSTRSDLYLRLQVTRGGGAIGLNPALADKAGFVILVQKLKELTPHELQNGLRLSLATKLHRNHVDTLNPAWKTGNYLNNILCLREAIAKGADEVVMTNLDGEITEAAVSNVFFVRDGQALTPPLSAGILAGITRRIILESVASKTGVVISETGIRAEDLRTFDECFVTSSTRDLVPVAAIDDVTFKVTKTSVTRRLKSAFADYMRDYVSKHLELKL